MRFKLSNRKALGVAAAFAIFTVPRMVSAQAAPTLNWLRPGFPSGQAVAAYAPNGSWYAVTGNSCVYIYASNGTLMESVPTATPNQEPVFLEPSPDGSTLAVAPAQAPGLSNQISVQLINVSTATSVNLTRTGTTQILCMAYSPDGKRIAVSYQLGGTAPLTVWTVATRQAVNYTTYAQPATSVAFSPDSQTLAVACNGSGSEPPHLIPKTCVELWSVSNNMMTAALTSTCYTAPYQVAFTPNGQNIVDVGATINTSTGQPYGVAEVWTVSGISNSSTPTVLTASASFFTSFAISPNSNTLCATGYLAPTGKAPSFMMQTWSLPSGPAVASQAYEPSQFAYSPDGTKIYASIQGHLVSFPSSLSGSPTVLMNSNNNVYNFAVAPSGASIVVPTSNMGYGNGTGLAICPTSGSAPSYLTTSGLTPFPHLTPQVAVNPMGNTMAVAGWDPLVQPGATPFGILLYNTATGAPITSTKFTPSGTYNGAWSPSWSPDGSTLAYVTVQSYPNLNAWLVSGSTASSAISYLEAVNAAAYSPSGTLYVDAGESYFNAVAEVRTVGSNAAPSDLVTNLDTIQTLAVSPDSTKVALGGDAFPSGNVEIWSLSSLTPMMTVYAGLTSVNGVAWSPDGKTLAVVGTYGNGQGKIEWWSIGKVPIEIGHTNTNTAEANCLAYSMGGGYLLVGTEQGVQFYSNANYGLTGNYGVVTGAGVSSVEMLPGGAAYAFTTLDGTVAVAENPNSAADIRVSIAINPGQIKGGSTATATLTLTAPAPRGGLTCKLSSNSTAAQPVNDTINIPEGKTSATVHIATKKVTAQTQADVQASVEAGSHTTTITVTTK